MKSIIVYTSQLKAQNLYPKRIISPPAPNKCCPVRMEVLGRPRVDEQGRRFCYKRCRVCGFALRYFLEPVPSILAPPIDEKSRKPLPPKAPPNVRVGIRLGHALARRVDAPGRTPAPDRHGGATVASGSHGDGGPQKSVARRRP